LLDTSASRLALQQGKDAGHQACVDDEVSAGDQGDDGVQVSRDFRRQPDMRNEETRANLTNADREIGSVEEQLDQAGALLRIEEAAGHGAGARRHQRLGQTEMSHAVEHEQKP
jgi:hypothetical protein